ncbi:MAG: MFS transporter [Cellvibrionaceae bacterium]|nr:MFS transporter [Cellvibrionaceae bacterium]
MKHRLQPQPRPELKFWQIWNMCFGFIGIQFGFALQTANVSRIFQTLGADIDAIPILWIAGPITGLLVQPIIGYMSDKTWNKFGRRRPYFTLGAVAASACLFIMPHSPALWMAAGMLWIMDASFNIAMEPFRAFVGDMLPPKQRTQGFAMQSFFIGVASVVASALPWILSNWLGIENTAAPGEIPSTVIYAFYFGAAVLITTVMWTVLRTQEYPPEKIDAFNRYEKHNDRQINPFDNSASYVKGGVGFLCIALLSASAIYYFKLRHELYILAGLCGAFGAVQLIAQLCQIKGYNRNAVYQITRDLLNMPRTMAQLAVVQFFSWFALFALWIYTTPAVTAFHYGTSETSSARYNQGADWVGILFAAYNGFAAIAAFFIPIMARRWGQKTTHCINLMLGAAGYVSITLITDPTWLWAPMVGIGFAWASILSLPYAMLAAALPSSKLGIYIGIFNFFIVIPQILAASVLGIAVSYFFDGQAIYALVLGGICLIIAAIATLKVNNPQ